MHHAVAARTVTSRDLIVELVVVLGHLHRAFVKYRISLVCVCGVVKDAGAKAREGPRESRPVLALRALAPRVLWVLRARRERETVAFDLESRGVGCKCGVVLGRGQMAAHALPLGKCRAFRATGDEAAGGVKRVALFHSGKKAKNNKGGCDRWWDRIDHNEGDDESARCMLPGGAYTLLFATFFYFLPPLSFLFTNLETKSQLQEYVLRVRT